MAFMLYRSRELRSLRESLSQCLRHLQSSLDLADDSRIVSQLRFQRGF